MVSRKLRFEGPSVPRPTPILDPARVRTNIARMADRARAGGVRLRPHFKTHQSEEIGRWFREQGVTGITVSSLRMASYFAACGWRDITVAFPVNLRELEELIALAEATSLGVLVDDPSVVRALAGGIAGAAARTRSGPETLRIWIKIDTGLGRAGARWDDRARLEALGAAVRDCANAEAGARVSAAPGDSSGDGPSVAAPGAARLTYAGVLTHAGHSYAARSRAALEAVHAESVARLRAARDLLGARIGRAGELSIGDTPTCSTVARLAGVDEIRPGNFVFHDLMQLAIGSCSGEDLAVALACPVVGKYEPRGEIVIYGGAVHLSKEALAGWPPAGTAGDRDAGERPIFGCLAIEPGAGLGRPEPRAPVVAVSQEHGVVRVPPDLWDAVAVGDLVLVYPVHSCLACDLHPHYVGLDGRVIERLTPYRILPSRNGTS